MAEKIESIEELKTLSENNQLDVFIMLAGGMARSSKTITYYPEDEQFYVFNDIDGTEQTLTESELHSKSNIGTAIDQGSLFKY